MDQNEDSTQNGKLVVRNYRILRNPWFMNRKLMQGFFGIEGMHLSGRVKISLSKHLYRVTRPNAEWCQNLAFVTGIQMFSLLSLGVV